MMSTLNIPRKHNDIMKQTIHDFIETEKQNSDLTYENIGYIDGGYVIEEDAMGEKPEEEILQENSSRTFKGKSEVSIVTNSSTDFSGSAPKRYTTKCYIEPKTVPYWYTESLFLNINSTRRKYEEKIFFKEKLMPVKWSETMRTEVTTFPKTIASEIYIPVEDTIYIDLGEMNAEGEYSHSL